MSADTAARLAPDPHTFAVPDGDDLAAMRTAAGLTQVAAAERAGLSVSAIEKIEAGDRTPNTATVDALLEVYRAATEADR